MSHDQTTSFCDSKVLFDETKWISHIRRALEEEEVEDYNDLHVSIFDVPKALRDTNPNAYIPQLVAIGPYHCWRSNLKESERFKLASAKRLQNLNKDLKILTIVERLLRVEPKIRACYHKYLDLNGETLAWIMAIDACFLLEVMNIYGGNKGHELPRKMSSKHSLDFTRRQPTLNTILRDIIMLENQIPLFVIREVLQILSPSLGSPEEKLVAVLMGLCTEVYPFKMTNHIPRVQPSTCDHLLDFVYHLLVPNIEETVEITEPLDQESNQEKKVCKLISCLQGSLERRPLKTISKLPWIILYSLPGLAILRTVFSPDEKNQNSLNNENSTSNSPLVEEIMIPSVVELSNSGVTFSPIHGDIMNIDFDAKNKKFYLPVISIDYHTEVLLRNLVAYEASSAIGPLVLTRYTELMNGIIDTEDDVKLLRERGIILNYLKSDKEVANLWNGMSKSLRLTRVPFMDEVIENVNKYYEGNWKVRLRKFVKAYVTNAWEFLAFLVIALLVSQLFVQSLSSVFYGFGMVGRQPKY